MENDLETLMNKSKLRSKDEIMDMLDYLYRLNWSAVELRIRPENHNNKKFPYDESIIHFRILALEWLVQLEKSVEDVKRRCIFRKFIIIFLTNQNMNVIIEKIREV